MTTMVWQADNGDSARMSLLGTPIRERQLNDFNNTRHDGVCACLPARLPCLLFVCGRRQTPIPAGDGNKIQFRIDWLISVCACRTVATIYRRQAFGGVVVRVVVCLLVWLTLCDVEDLLPLVNHLNMMHIWLYMGIIVTKRRGNDDIPFNSSMQKTQHFQDT